MKRGIFSFSDYKKFIVDRIESNRSKRGYQGRMAEAARCPHSYLSRVIHSPAHLSPEQALRVSEFLGLRESETDYFLELVNLARTSDARLVRRIKKRLDQIKAQAENLSRRFSEVTSLAEEREAVYYSSWHWSAIHLLVGIPGFQTETEIARRLLLPPPLVREALEKMEMMGLVKVRGGAWSREAGHVHLPKESRMIGVHHSNWRQRAVTDSLVSSNDSIHYTLVQSHSVEDLERIRQVFLNALDECREILRPSPNEELTCLCLDLFRV